MQGSFFYAFYIASIIAPQVLQGAVFFLPSSPLLQLFSLLYTHTDLGNTRFIYIMLWLFFSPPLTLLFSITSYKLFFEVFLLSMIFNLKNGRYPCLFSLCTFGEKRLHISTPPSYPPFFSSPKKTMYPIVVLFTKPYLL